MFCEFQMGVNSSYISLCVHSHDNRILFRVGVAQNSQVLLYQNR